MKKENAMKISKSDLINIIEEEIREVLMSEDDDIYGNINSNDADNPLYMKANKALNMWVSQKGRPSMRTWKGGRPTSFESVVKKLYGKLYKYIMAKAQTIPVREIPYYYGQIAGQQKDKGGGYKGAETTGKEKGWQGQKGSGIAGKGVK